VNTNTLRRPTLVMPGGAFASTPKRGMELVNLKALGIIPGLEGGRAHGTHVAGDIVTQTADGRDLNQVWLDFMDLLNAVNADRQELIRFLTFPVTNNVELVAQAGGGVDFEEASEFGQPVGARITPSYFNMGYTFKWYDLAARYTWQYLADATSAMVDSVANAAVEAFYRLQMNAVLKTVFNPTNLQANINQQAYTVYKFYNADGTVPPTYKTNVFDGTHTHFKTTGTTGANTAVIEAQDLDSLIIDDFASHGYTAELGYRLVLMVNTAQGNVVRTFRSATANAQAVGGVYGRYDFIQAQGQPGQLITLTQQIIGQSQVPNNIAGLPVIGNYGPLIIVQDDYLPTTHIFAFATGGENNLGNPIGIREHSNAALRGLKLVKGRQPDYPLIDSFWNCGFGTGVRQRGGGIVVQLTSGTTYTPPAAFA
jgi:hypothetical protein